MRASLAFLSALALGCGSDGDVASDAGSPSSPDARAGELPATCTGACATMNLQVDFGDVSDSFDRAFFGLTSPAESESGDWEIYIENHAGDDEQCPTMSSPTPRFLMTAAGLALPRAGDFMGTTTLVDFEGVLLTESVFEEASASTVTWVAADVCVACSEGSEPDRADRIVAFDIDATFSQGSIRGHSYATHCPSLDRL